MRTSATTTFEHKAADAIRTLTVVVVILGVGLALAIGLAAYGFATASDASHVASRAAAVAAHLAQVRAKAAATTAGDAAAIASAVAVERNAAILRDCQAQNARNVSTIAELKHIMAPYLRRARPSVRRQLRASEHFSLLLIDRLAPFQNCQQVLALDSQP